MPEEQGVDGRVTLRWLPGSDRGCDDLLDQHLDHQQSGEARARRRASQMEQICHVRVWSPPLSLLRKKIDSCESTRVFPLGNRLCCLV